MEMAEAETTQVEAKGVPGTIQAEVKEVPGTIQAEAKGVPGTTQAEAKEVPGTTQAEVETTQVTLRQRLRLQQRLPQLPEVHQKACHPRVLRKTLRMELLHIL